MRLLTVPQAAEQMAMTEDHVRTLLRRGELEAAKPGKRWLIAEESITAWYRRNIYVP